jgi:hypothetical protein
MEHRLESTRPSHAGLVIFAVLAALAAGCGDGFTGGGGGFGSTLARRIKDEMGGAQVELTLYTSCEGVGSKGLQTRCEGVRSAEIEVFFDGGSLIFDFSNAPRGGRISDDGFEGYVLSMTEGSELPALLDARIDTAKSSVNAEQVEIELDDTSVAVDFRGLEYDDATFVKIDLAFDEP